MNRLAVCIVTAASFLALSPSQADAKPESDRLGLKLFSAEKMSNTARKLNINEATTLLIRARVVAGNKESRPLRKATKALRHKLDTELQRIEADHEEVMRLVTHVGVAQIEQRKHNIKVLLDVRAMLKPDQIEQLNKLRTAHGKERDRLRKERRKIRKRNR